MHPDNAFPPIEIDLKDALSDYIQDLDAGYYLLNIRLEKGEKSAGRTEVVHIYDGLITAADFAFTDADFLAVVDLTSGVWQEGEITSTNTAQYYRFRVEPKTAYALSVQIAGDHAEGSDYSLRDLYVTIDWEDRGVSILPRQLVEPSRTGGYTYPYVYYSDSGDSGNVIIKIEGDPGATGTYAVGYSRVDDLIEVNPHVGTVAERTMKFYRFPVVKRYAL
jgi:hypothetical protein